MRAHGARHFITAALISLALMFTCAPGVHADDDGEDHRGRISAVVANPAGLRTQDPALDISQLEVNGLQGPVEVRSSAPGTGHWVHLPLDLPSAIHNGKGRTRRLFVVGVEVCHQEAAGVASPPASFIDRVRLSKLRSPAGSEIAHEDDTNLLSIAPTCARSVVDLPFAVDGAVTVSLELAFLKPDDVFRLGPIHILLSTRPEFVPRRHSGDDGRHGAD